jgi:hypothetical protein
MERPAERRDSHPLRPEPERRARRGRARGSSSPARRRARPTKRQPRAAAPRRDGGGSGRAFRALGRAGRREQMATHGQPRGTGGSDARGPTTNALRDAARRPIRGFGQPIGDRMPSRFVIGPSRPTHRPDVLAPAGPTSVLPHHRPAGRLHQVRRELHRPMAGMESGKEQACGSMRMAGQIYTGGGAALRTKVNRAARTHSTDEAGLLRPTQGSVPTARTR